MTLYQADAFTDQVFSGNPAAICITDEELSVQLMQSLAREINLSETAFVVPREDSYSIRWFTPGGEVDLCGHATLAAAFIMKELGQIGDRVCFQSRSGELGVSIEGKTLVMDFPREDAVASDCPDILHAALGVSFGYCGKNRMDYLLVLEDERAVQTLQPDFNRLKQLDARGLIVTAASSSGKYDFVSRFFAPRYGIDEDPVTGSAHCCLGPYWAGELGRSELRAYQASSRGGHVGVKVLEQRVLLSGQAVRVFDIEYRGALDI